MAQPSSGGNPVNTALRNELILQNIFTFLPLESLLTSSEVNKLWNSEARTYIRDHRKCTVFISSPTKLPCIQLEQLDQDLARMATVPFNSLKINLRFHAEPKLGDSQYQEGHESSSEENLPRNLNNSSYRNLISKFKLKHLWVSLDEFVEECPVVFLVFRLLTEAATELKSLSFEALSPVFASLFSAMDHLEFPRLQELEIWNVWYWTDDDELSLLQNILDGAQKLEKIMHDGNDQILNILPKNKYNLVRVFSLEGRPGVPFEDHEEVLDMDKAFLQSGPRVVELAVNCLALNPVPLFCNPYFHPLAQACSSFLKKLEIECGGCIEKIRMIPLPLPNVTHLSLTFDPFHHFDFTRQLQQVKFQYLFPKLEEVSLDSADAGILGDLPDADIDRELSNFVPDSQHSSLTTKKLCVIMEIGSGGLLQLMKTFPYLEHLDISARSKTSHALPYRDIFRFWPGLKTLVTGEHDSYGEMPPNIDADFCGIHQEELELLRTLEELELESLHVVPVRPCVSTMKNLETLSISFRFRDQPHHQGPASTSLFAVTEVLVLERMPWLNFSWNFCQEIIDPGNLF